MKKRSSNSKRKESEFGGGGFNQFSPAVICSIVLMIGLVIFASYVFVNRNSISRQNFTDEVEKLRENQGKLDSLIKENLPPIEKQADGLLEPPNVDGWFKAEIGLTSLSKTDRVFEYTSEIGTTMFFQYARNLESIPNDLYSDLVQQEIKIAELSFEQLIENKKLLEFQTIYTEVARLGKSDNRALKAKFRLTYETHETMVDLYAWVYRNRFLSLKFTPKRSAEVISDHEILDELLTAFGNATQDSVD